MECHILPLSFIMRRPTQKKYVAEAAQKATRARFCEWALLNCCNRNARKFFRNQVMRMHFETISVRDIDRYINRRGTVIVDLREREKFRRYHIRTARNIPYEVLRERGHMLSRRYEYIFYCDRGVTSLKAANEMGQKGYRAKSLVGGINSYIENVDRRRKGI